MKRAWQAERGVMAIELSIVLVLGVFLLAAVILMGRLTWHATAMQKGVAGARRIIDTLPRETLLTRGVTDAIYLSARNHIRDGTESAGLDMHPDWIVVSCVNGTVGGCGRNQVLFVSVGAYVQFQDTIFGTAVTGLDEADLDLQITSFQIYVP